MTLKTEIVALAVRVLAENGIIRKPDSFDAFISQIVTGETYDQQKAAEFIASTDRAVAKLKSLQTKNQVTKGTKN